MRTQRIVAERVQESVAAAARRASGVEDIFGEDELFLDLSSHLRLKGWGEERVHLQLEKLRWARHPLEPEGGSPPAAIEDHAEDVFALVVPAPPTPELPSSARAVVEPVLEVPPRGTLGFAVNRARRGRILHALHGCQYWPGVNYFKFTLYPDQPSQEHYDLRCMKCCGMRAAPSAGASSSMAASSGRVGSSSSGSSSRSSSSSTPGRSSAPAGGR